ncbi:MAG TPA: ABC transporter permease [Acidimicrobiales bacterium]
MTGRADDRVLTLGRALRGTTYWFTSYRRSWRRSLVPSVIGPVLDLIVMGKVLGSLVADRPGAVERLGGVDYLSFVGPAVVAVTALVTASTEGTSPVYHAMTSTRTYAAMRATPLTVPEIVVGHLVWMAVRVAVAAALVAAFLAVLGGTHSWQAVLLVPANVATGMAVACGVAAFAARQRTSGILLAWQRFGVVPMMLFAGVYFPVSVLPGAVQAVAKLTPLWHGIELSRALAAGTATVDGALPHLAYLAALAVAGTVVTVRTFLDRLAD